MEKRNFCLPRTSRASFLDALVKLIDPASVHFNKRCTRISQENTSRPVIHFKDGTTFETDVVIGTDGIKSTVRQAVTGKNQGHGVAYTRLVAYRTLLPFSDVRRVGIQTNLAVVPHCFMGVDKVTFWLFRFSNFLIRTSAYHHLSY